MKKVKSFKELEVYQLARQLAKEIFEVSKTFPREEMYSLTDQIRRASRSVGAQIAIAPTLQPQRRISFHQNVFR